MTYELTAQEASLIEAYRKLFPMVQEHIGGFVISLAKLHTIARRSGGRKREPDEAAERPVAYELTKPEAALLRAYRRLPQTDRENIGNVVAALVETQEAARRNGAEQGRETEAANENAASDVIMSEAAAVGAEAVNYSHSDHIVTHRKGKCK